MIAKLAILFGIEHFQQRRSGIAPEITAHLIDLVQHEDGIIRFDTPQRLQNPPRHSPDVGPSMPPYLSFIVNTPQRYAYEFPAHRPCNRTAQ